MRVIAGRAKGRRLYAPSSKTTRPITSMIKGALFNILQMRIEDSKFLDLFSGSGSIGIEAVSRGALRTVFVERDSKAIEIIKKNLALCGFSLECEVYQDDVFERIRKLKHTGQIFDIIYLDPPFTVDSIFLSVMQVLSDNDILAKNGIIVIRTKKEKEMPDKIGNLQKYRKKSYGISTLHFYNK